MKNDLHENRNYDMLSFKQFLKEDLMPRIHYNTNVPEVKAIVNKSNLKAARFSITKRGEVHAADAEFFNHDDIADASDVHIAGMIFSNHYLARFVHGRERPFTGSQEHTFLHALEKQGIMPR